MTTEAPKISVIKMYASREEIYPREAKGRYASLRWVFVWLTQLVFYGMPWMTWNGRQAVLFDLGARKFYIFSLVLWPQDFIYLAALLIISAYLLFLATAVAGRVWCGFACPQTVYTEIFMWIERKIEGPRSTRMRLAKQPMSAEKLAKKSAKHIAWGAVALLIALVLMVVSIGGLVEIVPLFFQKSTTEPVAGLKPYSPLRLMGRDIYVREGCYGCHSQMIRPFRAETERYGHYSVAGEFVYDHPFQWGSKRTGPDLARVGGRYSDEWHRVHLNNPRDVVPESNMPGYPWLATTPLAAQDVVPRMRALKRLNVPYTDEEIKAAPAELEGKTEQDALIAYLQGLGILIKQRN